MIYNHKEHFTKAVKFIDFLQNGPFFQTKNIFEANVVGTGGHIYRGQPDSAWELKPSVFRSFNALNDFTPQPPGKFTKDQKERWLGLHMHAELRSIFIFLEAADKLGIETPIDYSRVKDHYEIMQHAINDGEYDGEKKFPNEKALEELSLAQHHGIPTRILDWSESQLIACFFAAYGASSVIPEDERVKSENIAVFCLKTDSLSKTDELIKVNAPRHRNNFLQLQQGIFTHMPKANNYLLENDKWPSVENIIEQSDKLSGALKKYYLPTTEADNLLKLLFDRGITQQYLMPTLSNAIQSFKYASHLFKT